MLYVLVKATINNVFVIVVNKKQKVLMVKTPGSLGFLGPKRKTPFAAEVLGRRVSFWLMKNNIKKIDIILRTPLNKVTKAVLKGLRANSRVRLVRLRERIALAHNGIRARKARRI
jgi:ribosomal protein S11